MTSKIDRYVDIKIGVERKHQYIVAWLKKFLFRLLKKKTKCIGEFFSSDRFPILYNPKIHSNELRQSNSAKFVSLYNCKLDQELI